MGVAPASVTAMPLPSPPVLRATRGTFKPPGRLRAPAPQAASLPTGADLIVHDHVVRQYAAAVPQVDPASLKRSIGGEDVAAQRWAAGRYVQPATKVLRRIPKDRIAYQLRTRGEQVQTATEIIGGIGEHGIALQSWGTFIGKDTPATGVSMVVRKLIAFHTAIAVAQE